MQRSHHPSRRRTENRFGNINTVILPRNNAVCEKYSLATLQEGRPLLLLPAIMAKSGVYYLLMCLMPLAFYMIGMQGQSMSCHVSPASRTILSGVY